MKTMKTMKKIETHLQETAKKRPELKKDLELESRIFEIGYNISLLRQEKNYSQKEFADKLGMTQGAISRIESGQNMKCETLWKISDVLGEKLEIFGANVAYEKEKIAYYFIPLNGENIIGTTTDIKHWYDGLTNNNSFNLFTKTTHGYTTI